MRTRRSALATTRPAALMLAALALPVVAPRGAGAQAGGRAAVLLELPAGARATALGGAYSAAGRDAAAIFYNPAQAAVAATRDSRASASASFGRYLQSSSLVAAAAALRAGPGSLGLGVRALAYGSEAEVECVDPPQCTEGRATGGRVSAGDVAATLGYAAGGRRLLVGGAVGLVQQSVAGLSGRALTFDAGVTAPLTDATTLAVSAQGMGSGLRTGTQRAPLPRTVRVGAAHERELGAALGLTMLAELRGARGERRLTPAGGLELRWLALGSPLDLQARVGGAARPAGATGAQAVTVGGSVVYNTTAWHRPTTAREARFALDYAFESFQALGGVHRVGVRWWR